MPNTLDSNTTGLRFTTEDTIGVLPGSGVVWKSLEPNSYGDFGAQYTQVARNPIKPDRQRVKGVLTDKESSANFQTDFIGSQLLDLLSGFFFAAWRDKTSSSPTAVSGTAYTLSSVTGFVNNNLILAEGFAIAGNNGFKPITVSGSTLVASGLAIETPPATSKVTKVGQRGASGDITLTVSAGVGTLGSTTLNFTTLGLIAGEWLWIGGDATANKFATAANNGFYKIKTIAANSILFDKIPTGAATDAGATKLIDLYFGSILKNESDTTLIVKKSFQFERQYTSALFEYIKGCVANKLDFDIKTADKVVCEMGFVGIDAEDLTSAKAGTNSTSTFGTAYNSSSDFMKLSLYDASGNNLSSYITDLKISISNNATTLKAAGTLGGFDINVGDFMVSASLTAYFVNNLAVDAIRNNTSVSLSFALGQPNDGQGWIFDIPNMTLGDGRKAVEKDKPITLPLTAEAAADSVYNTTMAITNFKYLPALVYN
jgi:hypothetical protein